jgi:magnesium transporter
METVESIDVQRAIRERDFGKLHEVLGRWEPSAVAAEIRNLPVAEQAAVFRVVPRQCAADVFEFLDVSAQECLLKALRQEQVAAILNDMADDDRTALLEELPAAATQQMLALLTPEERARALSFLGYPVGSIGRLMTPHYIVVDQNWTVLQVMDYVRAHGQDSETLNMLYVIDDHGVLIDDIRLREFLLAPTDKRVADLMDYKFVALKAAEPQESAIEVFKREDRKALPVVDSRGVLIGIVTLDDVLKVAENQATREIQKIGGSEALDEPYMQIAISRMVKKRAGWLVILFLGEMLTATAMGFFESEIEKAVVLALFVPLIISSGGNSGSQATTLVIRAMALGEIRLRDWWRVMRREVVAGFALGSILGTIGFLRITVWSAFSAIYGAHWLLVAPIPAAARRARSGDVVCAVCGNTGRRDGAGHLLQRWPDFSPWHLAMISNERRLR